MGLFSWFSQRFSRRGGPPENERAAADFAGVGQLRLLTGRRPWPRREVGAMLRGYAEFPWLHAVVRRRAEALAAVEWVVYRSPGGRRRVRGHRAGWGTRHQALQRAELSGLVEAVWDHPMLDLLDKPNSQMSGYAFAELISKHLDLAGEAFLGIRRRGSRPVELAPIVPTWVTAIPSPDDPTFQVQPPNGARYQAAPDEIVWIRQHDPADPYDGRGVGTAVALGDELETDEYMAESAKARFYNRNQPDLMVGFQPAKDGSGRMGKPQLEALQKEWDQRYRGPERAGRTAFFGSHFTAYPLNHTMVESQYVEGRSLLRDFCLQVFGCPPEILGVLENANRSTIDAAELLFARFSTVPMLERIRAVLQDQVADAFGEGLILDYVSPIPTDRETRNKLMISLSGAFKVNEVRAAAGEDPDPERGDQYMVPPGAPRIPTQTTPTKAAPEGLEDGDEDEDDLDPGAEGDRGRELDWAQAALQRALLH